MYAAKRDATRAIGAQYLWRTIRPLLFVVALVLVLAYILLFYAAYELSGWWLLLLIGLAPTTVIIAVFGSILWFIHRAVLPRNLSRSERAKIQSFLDMVDRLAERSRTPYPWLLFLIAKDVVRGRESKVLSGIIGDSKGVMSEFREIERLF